MKNTLEVSFIGLGVMGSALARLSLRHGHRVTVWNRTEAKAGAIVKEGAVLAPSAAAAVAASPIVVICVHDYKATDSVIGTQEAGPRLDGRVLIQLTTGSPREARDSEDRARRRGAEYLDGAIQAGPSQMGRPDTTIFVSGAETTFRRSEALLKVFGGNLKYLGESVGAASAMDLATLSYIYGSAMGFFHGALISESEGFDADTYGSMVADVAPMMGEFLKHEGKVIKSGNYEISESPLRISVEATERLLLTARESRINSEFPAFAAALFKRALDAGYGDEEVAALIKTLR